MPAARDDGLVVVLSGGARGTFDAGARGAFDAGVVEAMADARLRLGLVSGTSAGVPT